MEAVGGAVEASEPGLALAEDFLDALAALLAGAVAGMRVVRPSMLDRRLALPVS